MPINPKEQEQGEFDVLTEKEHQIILHNDDVNTFDHVINCLIRYCDHTLEQAEQCAILIHSRGKYAVKEGSLEKLRPMKDAITERGINATIE